MVAVFHNLNKGARSNLLNKQNAFILYVIRCVFDEAFSIDKSKFGNCDFISILKFSLEHNITSLIYEGIKKHNSNL